MDRTDLPAKFEEANSSLINKWLAWILFAAVVAVTIVATSYFYHFNGIFSPSKAEWGIFGDFIGGTLNPVLSFLALIALLLTIVLQSKEMAETREELKRTADAQIASKALLDKQMETQRLQQFESTFFSLLNQLQEEYKKVEDAKCDIHWIHNNVPWANGADAAKVHLRSHNRFLGKYFRILYQTLKFIEEGLREFDDYLLEKRYSNIVRSLMTDESIQLLALNCYCDSESDMYWSYKILVERYEFFEHMPFERDGYKYAALEELIKHYDIKVFGKSIHISQVQIAL